VIAMAAMPPGDPGREYRTDEERDPRDPTAPASTPDGSRRTGALPIVVLVAALVVIALIVFL